MNVTGLNEANVWTPGAAVIAGLVAVLVLVGITTLVYVLWSKVHRSFRRRPT